MSEQTKNSPQKRDNDLANAKRQLEKLSNRIFQNGEYSSFSEKTNDK